MKSIKEVIVVEGKTDTNKLKSIFNVDTIETGGSRISEKTLNLISKIQKSRGIILFLDPDYQGEKNRSKILEKIPECKQAFIKKDLSKQKNGIAEASVKELKNSLKSIITSKNKNTITQLELQKLGLEGEKNSKHLRSSICNYYKIPLCNAKQLFKRLNMLGKNYNDIKEILEK